MTALQPTHPLWPSSTASPEVADDAPASRIWRDLSQGRLRVQGCQFLGDRAYLGLRASVPSRDTVLTPTEANVVLHVLGGKQQKVVAAELLVSPSTTSHRLARALRKIGVVDRAVPLPLVVAVQLAAGVGGGREAGVRPDDDGAATFVFSVRRPEMRRVTALTQAERHVAALTMEGKSRARIAEERRTSESTVARQVHAIFFKLRLFGRYELIRRAVELGCFE